MKISQLLPTFARIGKLKFSRRLSYAIGGMVSGGLVTVGVIWSYVSLQHQARNIGQVDQLSARAREFIAKDSSRGTGIWNTVELPLQQSPTENVVLGASVETSVTPTPAPLIQPVDTHFTTPCFTLTTPVSVARATQRQDGSWCVFEARLLSPAGELVIASYPAASFTEDSGVHLRQTQPDTYQASPIQAANFTQTVLFTAADNMTLFAWQKASGTMVTVALSGVTQPSKVTSTTLTSWLSAVQLTPGTSVTAVSPSAQPDQLLP